MMPRSGNGLGVMLRRLTKFKSMVSSIKILAKGSSACPSDESCFGARISMTFADRIGRCNRHLDTPLS